MILNGKKVSSGWLFVMTALIAASIIGVKSEFSEELFTLPGDHLWANIAWMITATIFVLMMTPGLSFFYGGMVRPKNVISTMLQSFIVMGFVSVIWVVFGFGLAFGDDVWHVIGNPADFFMMKNVGVGNITDVNRSVADRNSHYHNTPCPICTFPDEIRHNYPLAYHRGLCGTCPFLRLSVVYGTLDYHSILPVGTLHMASGRSVRHDACT